MAQTLTDFLSGAARGRFPASDGGMTVVPQPSRRDAGVLAFTAHSVVFTDEDPQWVRETLASARLRPAGCGAQSSVPGRVDGSRWEVAIEVDEAVRHRGRGAAAGRRGAASGTRRGRSVWAQQAPGNARGVRVFQAAGNRPIGAEILLLPRDDSG